jgi:hypothetical protein
LTLGDSAHASSGTREREVSLQPGGVLLPR